MKRSLFICGFLLLNLGSMASAGVLLDENWTVNTAIPDGNPVGITLSQTFESLPSRAISSVSVRLDITGGYNGDLYGYLVFQDANGHTVTETLLNLVGTSPSNPFGSSGSGFNVMLGDSFTANGSIHGATGIPHGAWQPDSASSLNGTFGGLTANGTWTLFLTDLSVDGGTSTLQSWGLRIAAAPEPAQTGWVLGMSGLMTVAFRALVQHRRKLSANHA
jgi:hypothetical protein